MVQFDETTKQVGGLNSHLVIILREIFDEDFKLWPVNTSRLSLYWIFKKLPLTHKLCLQSFSVLLKGTEKYSNIFSYHTFFKY